MSLKLYFHPLSSFCWKALIALYENGTRRDLGSEIILLLMSVPKIPVRHIYGAGVWMVGTSHRSK